MELKCLMCVGERLEWERVHSASGAKETPPAVMDALTLAPSWQMQQVGMQQVMACVAVPTCLRHLQVKEKTAAERAIAGGIVLPGMS